MKLSGLNIFLEYAKKLEVKSRRLLLFFVLSNLIPVERSTDEKTGVKICAQSTSSLRLKR